MITNTKENLEKLENYIKEKNCSNDIDIVDFMKFVSSNYGVYFKSDKKINKLKKEILLKRNVLLILVDGLGYYKVKSLSDTSILKQNLKMPMQTVNPSSTACVLTSLCSSCYPSEHGVFGWWQYDKSLDINYYPLLFKSQKGVSLYDLGFSKNNVYHFKSIFDRYNIPVNLYMRRTIINSDYSSIFNGKKANTYGCFSIKDAFTKIEKRLNEKRASFNYLYISGLDEMSHKYGVNSIEVNRQLAEIEEEIKKIKEGREDLTILVIADHGQVDMTSLIYLNQNENYLKYFYALPSMDTRMISFFVKEEYKEEFENKFCSEFGKDVILLTAKEAIEYKLFGPDNLSENALNSIGEYVAIVVNNKFLLCDKAIYEDKMSTKGNHSGLTREETTIPLIVI